MAELPSYLLVVEATVEASADDAFNRWYDEMHLPEITNCPGFVRSRRYVTEAVRTWDHGSLSEEGARRYLAVYELDSPRALGSPEFQARRGFGPVTEEVVATVSIYSALETR